MSKEKANLRKDIPLKDSGLFESKKVEWEDLAKLNLDEFEITTDEGLEIENEVLSKEKED